MTELEDFVRRIANNDFDPRTVQSLARRLVSPFPYTVLHSKREDGGEWTTTYEVSGTLGVLFITENHFGRENEIQIYPEDVDQFCENWAHHRGKVFGDVDE